MRAMHKYSTLTLVALATAAVFQSAEAAEELKPGYVINATNLDKAKNDTFEGHTLASLITDKMEFMIKNYNLSIKLRHSEEIPGSMVDIENTRKYASGVKFDPNTNEVTGYKAGLPFPNIDMRDPKAGYKAIYNYYYHNTYGKNFGGPYSFLWIDQEKGVFRTQLWSTLTLKMKGRSDGAVLGDGNLVNKELTVATAPYDVKGIGIFVVRYDSARLQDNWAYVKSVRRTRQLSGGSWMDNAAGSVQLNDEYDLFAARPSWYPGVKIVGKRWVLAVPHLNLPVVDESKKGTPEEFPTVDLKSKPYWNPSAKVEWEPREVYVIEVTPPQEHPYSKRVMYMEIKFPRFYMTEHYDKAGQFAKFQLVLSVPTKGDDGKFGMLPWQGITMDLKRKEGFIYLAHPSAAVDRSGVTPEDLTIGKLEAAAK